MTGRPFYLPPKVLLFLFLSQRPLLPPILPPGLQHLMHNVLFLAEECSEDSYAKILGEVVTCILSENRTRHSQEEDFLDRGYFGLRNKQLFRVMEILVATSLEHCTELVPVLEGMEVSVSVPAFPGKAHGHKYRAP